MPVPADRIIESVLEALLDLPETKRVMLARRLALLVEEEVRRERLRCVQHCRRRAELWRTTLASRSAHGAAREEARGRSNEAQYIADLLESGGDVVPNANS
jgi:hypothetical protein